MQEFLSGHALLSASVGSQRLASLFAWRRDGSQATSDDYTAAVAAFLFFLGVENGEDGFIKNSFETLLSQGRAFQVALSSYRFRQFHAVLIGEGLLLHVQQTRQGFGVISEINLGQRRVNYFQALSIMVFKCLWNY